MQARIILIPIFVLTTAVSYGQFWKRKKTKESVPVENNSQAPNSLSPTSSKKEYAPRASKKSSSGTTYDAEQKYYERMAALEKAKRKEEEMKLKPQYSDPAYFGHKRPPKRHKPGKMKFCKECGIRH
jgi:hypothetical protein